MKCHVKVELLDSENNVTKSTETDGIITNAYKYLSTWGFPGVARDKIIMNNTYNADLTFGGVIGFKLALPEDEDDFRYDLSNLKTCYATRYSADYSAISDKIGTKMPDLCEFTSTSYKQVWVWGESQGNGVISSVCLTHAAGAGAFDVTPPKDKTAAFALGNDCLGTIIPQTNTSYRGTAAFNVNTSYAQLNLFSALVHHRASSDNISTESAATFFYQTDKYIMLLYASEFNTALDSGFRTTLKYRRIPKENMYRWNGLGLGTVDSATAGALNSESAHRLSAPTSDVSGTFPDNSWDGELVLNTPYELRSYTESRYKYQSDNYNAYWAEDNFAVIFFMLIPFPSDPDDPDQPKDFRVNPDGIDVGMPNANCRTGTYIITGDTPSAVLSPSGSPYFDSEWNSPLLLYVPYAQSSRGIMIKKDLTYVYRWFLSASKHLACRKLDGDTLVWNHDISDSNTPVNLEPATFLDPSYFLCPWYAVKTTSTSTTWSSGVYFEIRKSSDGSILGYTMKNSANRSLMCLYPMDKNMFYLYAISSQSVYLSALNTNYMYAKFNLPTAITKTSSSKLRITATVEL